MKTNKQVWVSPNDQWRRVHKPWSQRDIAHTNTKIDAEKIAKRVAQNQQWETKIQKRDWTIHKWNSYGNDPYPPKDTK